MLRKQKWISGPFFQITAYRGSQTRGHSFIHAPNHYLLRTYHIPGTCVPPLMFTTTGKKFYPHFTTKGGLRGMKFPKPQCFLVLLLDLPKLLLTWFKSNETSIKWEQTPGLEPTPQHSSCLTARAVPWPERERGWWWRAVCVKATRQADGQAGLSYMFQSICTDEGLHLRACQEPLPPVTHQITHT